VLNENTYNCPIRLDISSIVDNIYDYIISQYPDLFDEYYPENLKSYLQKYISEHELDSNTEQQILSIIQQINLKQEPFVSILKSLREVLLKSIIEAIVKPLLDKSWEKINTALNDVFCLGEGGNGGTSVSLTIYRETYTAPSDITAGTSITIPNGRSYSVGENNLMVYVNGVLQTKNEEYTEDSSTSISFTYDLPSGAIIDFVIFS